MRKEIYIFNFIGVSILLFLFSIVAIFSTILLFGGHCQHGIFLISLIISIAAAIYLFSKHVTPNNLIVCSIAVILIVVVSMIICALVFSEDWDGNAYHKLAIGLLKNGWNPIRESGSAFSERYFNSTVADQMGKWIDHYGKSTWLFASVIYDVTNNIECGKAYQILGCISLLCISFSYFLSHKKKIIISVIFAFLLTFNPVSVSQILSYYVDGFLFSLFYILIIALLQLVDNNTKDKKICWVMVFSSMLILSNVKFTGFLYGGIVCILMYGGMLVYGVFIDKKKNMNSKLLLRYFFAFVILAVLCICWIGYPTYICNYIGHKSFTYPLTGEGKFDIITPSSPAGFVNKSHIYQLYYGIFGQVENLAYYSDNPLPKLKIPFSIHAAELVNPNVDMRIGGFGFFFSGLLIIALIGIMRYIINPKNKKSQRIIVALSLLCIIVMTIVIPAGWWARYNPFLWLVLFIYLCLFELDSKIKNILCYVISAIIFVNTAFFAFFPITCMYHSYISSSKSIKGGKIKTDLGNGAFPGVLFNLEDDGIEYEIVTNLEQRDGDVYGISYAYDNP